MALITNLQKYCIHDGKGIRTTVFFKGCPLRCEWCHNPETQSPEKQLRGFPERCVKCGSCIRTCPAQALKMTEAGPQIDQTRCQLCGSCVESCRQNALELIGEEKDVPQLVRDLSADQMFYEESDGGVTLSGGEVMTVDSAELCQLVKTLYDRGISVNIDTCGFCSFEKMQALLPYTDTFLYDLKVLDDDLHRRYTGASNRLILENLKKLAAENARIWIRIPVIRPVNADEESIREIGTWLRNAGILPAQINLMPYHDYGEIKYRQLWMEYEGGDFSAPSDAEMEDYREILHGMGFQNIKIGG